MALGGWLIVAENIYRKRGYQKSVSGVFTHSRVQCTSSGGHLQTQARSLLAFFSRDSNVEEDPRICHPGECMGDVPATNLMQKNGS